MVAVIGCNPPDEDPVEAPKEVTAEFTGKVDASWAGNWESSDQRAHLVLNKDGTLTSTANVATRGGMKKADEKGEWRVDGDALIIRISGGSTSKFFFTKTKPDEVELRQVKGSKIKTVYVRKKA